MRVALVTTWGMACGIAEHSTYLKAAVEAADYSIAIEPITDLHPHPAIHRFDTRAHAETPDLLHLNYHAALHSQWTPEYIRTFREVSQKPVAVTYHDTGVPNSDQAKQVCATADAFVVHEPYDDLEGSGRYWRMGVPAWLGVQVIDQGVNSWTNGRPILGTVGFPYPWKNYDELARVTAANGWAFDVIAPTAASPDVERWLSLNPWMRVTTGFLHRTEVVARLSGCDATAFCYTCANTGQSGAVLQGIAARKPVIAFRSCRQFRALAEDPLGREAILWADSFDQVGYLLRTLTLERCHPGIVALAEQESWTKLGAKYAGLWRSLVP